MSKRVCVSVPLTTYVIWRQLRVKYDRLNEPEIEFGTPVYLASGLSIL